MSNGSGLFSNQQPQRQHLVRAGGGVSGEVADLRDDISKTLGAVAAMTVDEFTDVAVADADAIRLAAATVASARTLSGSDLDGAVGEAEMDPPRNITVTTAGATPADAPASVVINGKVRDTNGNLIDQTETLNPSQVAGAAVGALAFSTVESIEEAAGDGVGATLAYGFGALIGLGKPLISRAGLEAVLTEIEAGTAFAADAVTGTFVDAANAAPNGTYVPNNAPNDTRDYAVYYEYDPTV